jgi:hypothetical protein
MDHSKVHMSSATSLDPEPDTQGKHTTRPGPPRAVTTTYFAEAEHIARLLLAQDIDGGLAGDGCRWHGTKGMLSY